VGFLQPYVRHGCCLRKNHLIRFHSDDENPVEAILPGFSFSDINTSTLTLRQPCKHKFIALQNFCEMDTNFPSSCLAVVHFAAEKRKQGLVAHHVLHALPVSIDTPRLALP
jgi:hypothetical protein